MGVQFAGNILASSQGGPLPITMGGTGETSAAAAINALMPSQAGNAGKALTTDGSNLSWENLAGNPGGSDTYIQYNDAGNFGGSSFLTVNKSTGAVTSTSTLTNTGLNVTAASGTNRAVKFQTAGSNRWIMQANSTAESGTQAGSDFELIRYADNGSTQNTVFSIERKTGVVDFKTAPTVNGVAISGDAGSLTGTTLASNVVSSSLTSVGTITSGTWSGSFGAVSGANLTSLNASNISSGTVAPARLGTGTADSTTFLRGDGTWQVVSTTAAAGTLTGTTLASNVVSSSLTSVGTITSGTWSGSFGAVSGANLTSLNASNISSGTVAPARLGTGTTDNTTFLRGDGTWQVVSTTAAAGTLTGTTLASNVVDSSLTSVGTLGSLAVNGPVTFTLKAMPTLSNNMIAFGGTGSSGNYPAMAMYASTSTTGNRRFQQYIDRDNGSLNLAFYNDDASTGTEFLTVSRSANTATSIRMASTAINLAVGTGGLQLNGSAGTSGQVLTSNGASAAPTWQDVPNTSVAKLYVTAATTANITLSGGQTVDGVSVGLGDRVLVKNQTTTTENGIWVGAVGSWTRATDCDSASEANGAMVAVRTGNTLAGSIWLQTANITTVGTQSMVFQKLSSTAPDPTSSLEVANKQYTDNSQRMKFYVDAASTGNVTLSDGQTLDGVSVGLGNRVLVKNQSTATENGVYFVQVGAWARMADFDAANEVNGAVVVVKGGNTQAGTMWLQNANITTVGTQAMVFQQLGGGSTAAAGTLTGTTLASNVVSSSLTSVGTITSGTWSGSFGAVSGANLTTLNASNLSSGTVGTARLGTGTADNTTFLRGDGTWTAPTILKASGSLGGYSSSTTAINIGLNGSSEPAAYYVNNSSTANNKIASVVVNSSGSLVESFVNDAGSTTTAFRTVTRSGTTASLYTITSTGVNLAVGTSGLQLNGAAGTSGQVLTSNGSAAAPTWQAAPAAAAGTLTGTTLASNVVSSSLTSVGTLGSLTVTGATTSGTFVPSSSTAPTNGVYLPATNALGFSTNSTERMRLDASGNLGIGVTPSSSFRLDLGAAGSNGRIRSGGVIIGNASTGYPTVGYNATPASGTTWTRDVADSASWVHYSAGNHIFYTAATGTAGSAITPTELMRLTTTGAISVGSTGTATGTAGQVLTSSGSSAAPVWADPAGAAANLPRVTSISSSVVGKRVAVSTGQTITATTWAGGGNIAVGDIYSIYNDSASPITLTAGSGLTMYKDGFATSVSTITLAARGSCSIWYNTVSEVVVSGSIV